MGILGLAKPVIVICTRDRGRATAFYRDTLELVFTQEDDFATVFTVGDVTLRISMVVDFTLDEHTILGFSVADVATTVKSLTDSGLTFQRYPHIRQDEFGVCTLPGGTVRVAWFRDPDGNVLGVTNA